MTTATIDPRTTTAPSVQEFWRDAAAAHGRALDTAALEAVERLADAEILRRWFADLSDPEQHELLWAYGAYLSDGQREASG
jgi:hypothetical protein